MDIFTLAIVVSVSIFIAAGVYAGRSVKKLDDYFVGGRQAPTLLIVGTLFASVFSTSIFLGGAGFTYDGQLGPANCTSLYNYGAYRCQSSSAEIQPNQTRP